jgi:hypothetical protein
MNKLLIPNMSKIVRVVQAVVKITHPCLQACGKTAFKNHFFVIEVEGGAENP